MTSVREATTSVFDRYAENPVERREAVLGVLLILPAVVLIGAVILYPIAYNVYLSFTEVPLNPNRAPQWVGLGNYVELLTAARFWSAFTTTVAFTVGSTVLSTVVGLAVALLFDREFRGRRLARGLVLLPHVTPIIAVAFVWQFMLSPLWGSIPNLLAEWGLYGTRVGLLEQSATALPVVVVFSAWRNFPFAFLLFVARLQAIPESMYEAARIDGAGALAQFKDITLPELKGTIAIVVLLRFIWEFNTFAEVWLLTRQVLTLPIFAYQTAFANFEQGLGAAISLLLFLVQALFVLGFVTLFGEDKV
ncbi:multiple sugar transport system permease protein [Halogeometricum rufum]|uniref:Multiple sugar transport system permease protein n=1 Tax=Halogeometricum rufum TaxID=553469 RepID=A0A1I6IRT8_9EURY|nr:MULTISPECIES: sugar ABC transporter permease [Halogeometricum]MUV58122.1 ABC transporter permease subunit [Halogeometricum sp. CBA1124]SFR69447.1 multiple sugar transport system permease protein [Halogeometricum rufum]